MRKYHKKQILELIQTLLKATNEIKEFYVKKEFSTVVMLLMNCQDAAINIGQFIEKLEGEGSQTVSLLEDYCELLYKISQKLEDEEKNELFVKPLILQLNHIAEIFDNEFKEAKIEIAFFPYKASMWDSLESIWRAAQEDLECDAYVVPIPYYERLSDGTFGQIHYEGALYPEDVPITDWKQYDVKVRHPDVIFIHSPYDAGNYVTSIHPDFYSEKLKHNTDLLIYISYFIAFGDLPDNLCITSGSLNADSVIVQSKEIMQTYIRAFQNFEKQNGHINRKGKFENKILAMGSPKFDKVITSIQKDFHLPDKWKRLIENPERIHKKIIFYNTSLNAILGRTEQYLKKLHSVLEVFRKLDNVILWWRPHPLSEATFSSMRPRLLSEYKQIISTYQQEGWGIYDDSPDLHRAISWCDAYYGDCSSVAELFLAAKKPVMIQTVEELPISFENFIRAENSYWFTAFNFNGLFKINDENQEADCIGCFPEEKNGFRLFHSIVQYKNMLIFTPFSAEGIAIYRFDTQKFSRLPLKIPTQGHNKRVPYSKQSKFSFCAVYKDNAFFFPCTYPAIIKMNLKTMELEYLYNPIIELSKIVKHKQSYYFRNGVVEGKTATFWCVAANTFVEFDMETYRFKCCFSLNRKERYVEFINDNTAFWLIPEGKSRNILKISKDFLHIDSIEMPNEIILENLPFLYSVVLPESLYIFPGTAKSVMKIDKQNNHVEAVSMFNGEHMEKYSGLRTDWKFFFALKIENKIFAFNNFAHQLITYDFETGNIKNQSIKAKNPDITNREQFLISWKTHYLSAVRDVDLAVCENFQMPLESFLNMLSEENSEFFEIFYSAQKRIMKNENCHMDGTCGEAIYKYAKNYMEKEVKV